LLSENDGLGAPADNRGGREAACPGGRRPTGMRGLLISLLLFDGAAILSRSGFGCDR
jgi:hypothetical protein